MIYKLAGTALVVFCAFIYSEQRGRIERERIEATKVLLRFFEACASKVSCHSLTLSEIIDGFECDREEWNALFKKIKSDGLLHSVKFAGAVLCGKEELEIYTDFAQRFGLGFIKESENVCREGAERLRELICELDARAKKDGRARLALSLCVSFMTCLLFFMR